ncbi:hypothetical protein G3I19_12695 [Streptomyces sp. SID10853]|uniref:hypothetical protein n=1 Tax=Streptomyces sp. SID10853 TaxID=2706028 RepID=UPI0013C06F6F|nr:hypothetical protein [Streptomyces sp. SID10853]NDZ79360.1 hypothetical protein [Streptomyces sp. SID10853]
MTSTAAVRHRGGAPAVPAPDTSVRYVTMGTYPDVEIAPGRSVRTIDLYDLDAAPLTEVKGLMLSLGCDQIFLERRRALLEDFVRAGGRIVVNGHVSRPFLPGLAPWRAIDHHGADDLRIVPVTPHPVWEGVDYDELLFRTGVPGTPRGAELARLGVAGFYGRGYHARVPANGTVVNAIGPYRLPLDVVLPLGDGAVLAHAGNDLHGFCDPDRSTRNLGPNLIDWLKGSLT